MPSSQSSSESEEGELSSSGSSSSSSESCSSSSSSTSSDDSKSPLKSTNSPVKKPSLKNTPIKLTNVKKTPVKKSPVKKRAARNDVITKDKKENDKSCLTTFNISINSSIEETLDTTSSPQVQSSPLVNRSENLSFESKKVDYDNSNNIEYDYVESKECSLIPNDDVDLYGDLEENIFQRTEDPNRSTKKELAERVVELESLLNEAYSTINTLREELKISKRHESILHTNSLSLFETAKEQMCKKDIIIRELQNKCTELQKCIPSSNPKQKLIRDSNEISKTTSEQTCGSVLASFTREAFAQNIIKAIADSKRIAKSNNSEEQNKSNSFRWNKKIIHGNSSFYFYFSPDSEHSLISNNSKIGLTNNNEDRLKS